MLLGLAVLLLILWLLGIVTFHAVGGIVHILLIIAVIALVLHFMRGRRGGRREVL
ncbi:MAG TPA: lmo0937 family membrane protein [Candidatus Dormibacteraeota bacterium]|nr:lmo0937 family membrane protein [Candidatus Dormibacteraeota bacterium]